MNKKQKRMAGNAVIIILVLSGAGWILSMFIHIGGEYTDNASAKQHIVEVYSRTQGFVKKIYFEEYQFVRAGDTLVVLEDGEQRENAAIAKANYHNAIAGRQAMDVSVGAAGSNFDASSAVIRELETMLANAKADYDRYSNLYEARAATRQQYDAAKTSYEAMLAKLETNKHSQRSAALHKEEQNQKLGQSSAGIEAARASMELAMLNLSYTIITAPCDGYIISKQIQVGELARHGQLLLSVVNSMEKWVIAYLRETQLVNVHTGSMVSITFDALPDTKFDGVVSSIGAATGEELAGEHRRRATGNFVKVEQRIAVKIVFTNANDSTNIERIRAGMNAECIFRR